MFRTTRSGRYSRSVRKGEFCLPVALPRLASHDSPLLPGFGARSGNARLRGCASSPIPPGPPSSDVLVGFLSSKASLVGLLVLGSVAWLRAPEPTVRGAPTPAGAALLWGSGSGTASGTPLGLPSAVGAPCRAGAWGCAGPEPEAHRRPDPAGAEARSPAESPPAAPGPGLLPPCAPAWAPFSAPGGVSSSRN